MEQSMFLKNLVSSAAVVGTLAVGAIAATSIPASAYVACNHEGDCWHTDARVRAPGLRFDYHPDDWYFHRHWDSDRDHHWRDSHEGRGYYKGGVWITL
jgi:hypothetical protein